MDDVIAGIYAQNFRGYVRTLRGKGLSEEDACDVVSHAFTKVLAQDIRNTNPAGYVTIAVLNTYRNHGRRENRRKVKFQNELDTEKNGAWHRSEPNEELLQDDIVAGEELVGIIEEEIEKLPDGMREVLKLRITGTAYKDISESLNIKLGTVKSSLHKAKTQLAKALAAYPDFQEERILRYL